MHLESQIIETAPPAADHPAAMTIEERIKAYWDVATSLPPGERETAMDIVAIKYRAEIEAAQQGRTITAPSNVISFADRRSKLPRGL